jgi:hypothetical protein
VDNSVEVRYAGVVVGRGSIVKDLGAGSAFVGVPEPLPVGTLVMLKIGDAVHEARVDDVVESSEPTIVGMRVSWGGAARPAAPEPRAESPQVVTPVAARPAPAAAPAPTPAPAPVVAAPTAAPVEPVAEAADASSAIPAPISLAGPAGDGSHQGGGKKRRKRR